MSDIMSLVEQGGDMEQGTHVKYKDYDPDADWIVREGWVSGPDYDTHIMCWVPSLDNNVAVAKGNIVETKAPDRT